VICLMELIPVPGYILLTPFTHPQLDFLFR